MTENKGEPAPELKVPKRPLSGLPGILSESNNQLFFGQVETLTKTIITEYGEYCLIPDTLGDDYRQIIEGSIPSPPFLHNPNL